MQEPPTIGQRSRLGSRNWQSRRPSATSEAQGAIALNADAGTSQIDVDLRALDLDHLMRALDLPYVVASRAGGRITARWPGLEYARADGDGQLTLTPTRKVPSRNVLPVGGSLIAAARDQRVVLDIRDLRALGAALDGQVTLADQRVLGGNVAPPCAGSRTGRPRCGIVSGTPSGHARRHADRWRGQSRRPPRRRHYGAVR